MHCLPQSVSLPSGGAAQLDNKLCGTSCGTVSRALITSTVPRKEKPEMRNTDPLCIRNPERGKKPHPKQPPLQLVYAHISGRAPFAASCFSFLVAGHRASCAVPQGPAALPGVAGTRPRAAPRSSVTHRPEEACWQETKLHGSAQSRKRTI